MKAIILVGLPGSGKSSVCHNWFPGYVRINQDTLGNRQACIDEMVRLLSEKKDVIIDRVNSTKQQRKFWVDIALQMGVESLTAVVLDVPTEECIARIHNRKNHPTIAEMMPLEKKRQIVYNFDKSFELPSISEGFSTVIIHKNY
jgi:predicted kinase